MDNNSIIRQELLRIRWSLNDEEKEILDRKINNKLINLLSKDIKTKYIGIYWPIEKEVDTIRTGKWM